MSTVLLETKNLTKCFGALKANSEISWSLRQGTIHGIVGENGCGKSTFLKMLFGLYRPTSGEIWLKNKEVEWRGPLDAIESKMGMVQQHFALIENLSAIQNIILGAEPVGRLGVLKEKEAIAQLESLLPSPSLKVPWHTRVSELPVGQQQKIELLKILYRQSEILFLDEPTAVLTPQEIEDFLEILKLLRKQGKTLVLISHKLAEIKEVCDEVTVLRAGKLIYQKPIHETHEREMVRAMMGRDRTALTSERSKNDQPVILLEMNKVHEKTFSRGQCQDMSLQLQAGEILGIAGIDGSGQKHFVEIVLGLRPFAGEFKLFNQAIEHSYGPLRAREMGISIVPEERLKEGLWGSESCAVNLSLGLEDPLFPFGIVDQKKLEKNVGPWAVEFDVRFQGLFQEAQTLSGGNQQKLIFAREVMGKRPKILICHQPTRGVDLGAIDLIHQKLLDLRAAGIGIIVISSDLDELFLLSDRMVVFYEGRSFAHFHRTQFDPRHVGMAMTGLTQK
ncbi:MAG: ABC transporter ATP-binding protein [Bacteriovoracaceae bacterium]|nr:ABC transporter ATP-binding protein [Bacteriovoracaceae bacterium]